MPEAITLTAEIIAGQIPCLVAAEDSLQSDAPLALILHGLGGRKEKMLSALYEFAYLGCRAVAVDARLHGERLDAGTRDAQLQADYFGTTANMIEGTVEDIIKIVGHFAPIRAGLHGISLGGYIAFAAMLAEPRLNVVSVALGSPDWLGPLRRFGVGPGHSTWERATLMNPLTILPQVEPPRPLLMLHGTDDIVVLPDGVIALEKSLRPLYSSCPEQLELHLYPGLGHDYPDDMLSRTRNWFARYLI